MAERRRWMLGMMVASLVLAGCTGGAPLDTGDEEVESPMVEEVEEVEVYLVATDAGGFLYPESWYKVRPATPAVQVGDLVNLTYKSAVGNNDGAHTLVVEGLGIRLGPLAAGQSAVHRFVAEEAGTFTFYCDVGQHRTLGMEGTLTIRP